MKATIWHVKMNLLSAWTHLPSHACYGYDYDYDCTIHYGYGYGYGYSHSHSHSHSYYPDYDYYHFSLERMVRLCQRRS